MVFDQLAKPHSHEHVLIEHAIVEEEHVHLRKIEYTIIDGFQPLNLYRIAQSS